VSQTNELNDVLLEEGWSLTDPPEDYLRTRRDAAKREKDARRRLDDLLEMRRLNDRLHDDPFA